DRNQAALLAVARQDGLPRDPSVQGKRLRVEAEPALLLLLAVAGDAVLLQDGLDVADEVDGRRGLAPRRVQRRRHVLGRRASREKGQEQIRAEFHTMKLCCVIGITRLYAWRGRIGSRKMPEGIMRGGLLGTRVPAPISNSTPPVRMPNV